MKIIVLYKSEKGNLIWQILIIIFYQHIQYMS